jgi:hypothetical protein
MLKHAAIRRTWRQAGVACRSRRWHTSASREDIATYTLTAAVIVGSMSLLINILREIKTRHERSAPLVYDDNEYSHSDDFDDES